MERGDLTRGLIGRSILRVVASGFGAIVGLAGVAFIFYGHRHEEPRRQRMR